MLFYQRFVLVLLIVLLAQGCVRRRLTVRSSPPGARVYVDDREIGTTPVSTPFTYYGTRKIQLVSDGYNTETVYQRFAPPWYQIPPLDFFSENANPHEIRDERELHFQLTPQHTLPPDQLMQRAENLRMGAQRGMVAPPP